MCELLFRFSFLFLSLSLLSLSLSLSPMGLLIFSDLTLLTFLFYLIAYSCYSKAARQFDFSLLGDILLLATSHCGRLTRCVFVWCLYGFLLFYEGFDVAYDLVYVLVFEAVVEATYPA